MSRNVASSGVFLPRHKAPINAGEKSFNGSARTFAGSGRFGTVTPSPMPKPFATYVSIKSIEQASTVGNHSTPSSTSRARKFFVSVSVAGRQMSESEILSRSHNSSADFKPHFFPTSKTSGNSNNTCE